MGELQLVELTTLAAEDTGAREGDRGFEASDGLRFWDLSRYCSMNLTLCF